MTTAGQLSLWRGGEHQWVAQGCRSSQWRKLKQSVREVSVSSYIDASRNQDKAQLSGSASQQSPSGARQSAAGEAPPDDIFDWGPDQSGSSAQPQGPAPTPNAASFSQEASIQGLSSDVQPSSSTEHPQTTPPNGNLPQEANVSQEEPTADTAGQVGPILRKLAQQESPDDILEAIPSFVTPEVSMETLLQPDVCLALFDACLARGNVELALDIYRAMTRDKPSGGLSSTDDSFELSSSAQAEPKWPPADTRVVQHVVASLVSSLRVQDAIEVIQGLQFRGLPNSEEVPFGSTVYCPFPPYEPLCVMQPQTAVQQVRCATTRYVYDLTAGKVLSVTSQETNPQTNWAIRMLQNYLSRTPATAVHEILLQGPDGQARTFRCGTPTNEVPCQEGEKITVVSVPTAPLRGMGSVLPPSAPNTVPGQALSVTNHQTGLNKPLVRPPPDQSRQGLPGWVAPVAVVLAGSDAATGMIDPALPLVGIGALALVVGNAVVFDQVVIPRLKQLPVDKVAKESVQQSLLARHDSLVQKLTALVEEASMDVRLLARLWQLTKKMQILGGSGEELYAARLERVDQARTKLGEKLAQQLELIEQFARVVNMIEVEVELDMQVPEAEVANIEEQIAKLYEVEELQREWQAQVQANDEVERILKVTV